MRNEEQIKKLQDLNNKDLSPEIKKSIEDKQKHLLNNKTLKK